MATNDVTDVLKFQTNIRLLTKELSAPRYGSYFVYFTDRVKKSELKQLAEADSFEVGNFTNNGFLRRLD